MPSWERVFALLPRSTPSQVRRGAQLDDLVQRTATEAEGYLYHFSSLVAEMEAAWTPAELSAAGVDVEQMRRNLVALRKIFRG